MSTTTDEEYKAKKDLWRKDVQSEKIRLVMSQTNYSEDEAQKVLEENEWNCMKAIQIYMSPQAQKEEPKSTNQMIFKEIRTLMDSASMNYYKQKEIDEYLQKRAEEMSARNDEVGERGLE